MEGSMLDQGVPVPGSLLLADLREIDGLVSDAIQMRDDTLLIGRANTLRISFQLSGIKLAKLLSQWKRSCTVFGIQADDWTDHVFAATGLAPQTIYKYVNVWDTLFEGDSVPEDLQSTLLTKPMQGLLLLPAAVKEGQLDEADWDELSEAPDAASMREVVRRARGQATSSGTAIQLRMRRDGVIEAWRGGESEAVGFLRPEHADRGPLATAAVERICRAAGIMLE